MVRSSRVLHHLQAREGRLCTSLLATCWWSKLYVQLSLRGCGADSLTSTPTSLLSIINKFAVLHFPYPAALTGFQYAVSAAAVIVLYVCAVLSLSLSLVACEFPDGPGADSQGAVCMGLLRRSLGGWVDPVNLVDYHSVRQMFPVLLTFYGSVYSNMKVRV